MTRYRQTKNSGNSDWSDKLYHGEAEDTPQAPTVTTDSLSVGFSQNFNMTGTVVSEGSSSVIEYGFVWATHDSPTVASDNVSIKGTGSFTGTYTKNVTGLGYPATIYIAAYATNSEGTGYGVVLSDDTDICLAAGTLVSTPRGKQEIESIDYADLLTTWDFDEARFAAAQPCWIVRPFTRPRHSLLTFSNGRTLKTIPDSKGHRIFNIDKGMFTYPNGDDTPIGTRTFTENREEISLVAKEIVEEETTFYNVITNRHMNVFANDILTSTGLNNIYPIANMQFVKDGRKLREREEFDVSDELFEGLRLAEQPTSYPYLMKKLTYMAKHQLICVGA